MIVILEDYEEFEMVAGTIADEEELGQLRYDDDGNTYALKVTIERGEKI